MFAVAEKFHPHHSTFHPPPASSYFDKRNRARGSSVHRIRRKKGHALVFMKGTGKRRGIDESVLVGSGERIKRRGRRGGEGKSGRDEKGGLTSSGLLSPSSCSTDVTFNRTYIYIHRKQ